MPGTGVKPCTGHKAQTAETPTTGLVIRLRVLGDKRREGGPRKGDCQTQS